MPIEAASFVVHIRCDKCLEHAKRLRSLGLSPATGQFTGPSMKDCRAQARKAGWRFGGGGKVYCPTDRHDR